MGYRNYFGFIPKDEYDVIKDMTKQELIAHYGAVHEKGEKPYIESHKIVTQLHCLGHRFGMDVEEKEPFFSIPKTNKFWQPESEFFIVDKEVVENAIEHCRQIIIEYYKDLLKDAIVDDEITTDKTKLSSWWSHLNTFLSIWNYITPYDLEQGDKVTRSGYYEYEIFDLIRVYKTFDWENNHMIYYGW